MQLRKIIWKLLLNTAVGLLLFSYLKFSQQGEFFRYADNWLLFYYVILVSNSIGFTIVLINIGLSKIAIWNREIGFRFIAGLIINYSIAILIILISLLTYIRISSLNNTFSSFLEEYQELTLRVYILILVLDILLVVFDFLIYSYKYYSNGQIQMARLSREQKQLQFDALKTQLSPHYLFNSLNTISSLVYQNVNLTEAYIRKLANTYQYILESDKNHLISLKEEIVFIKDYCYLLNIRFGKAFKVYIDIPKSVSELYIPPISIQILVENAVKHNVFDDDNPLEIDIVADEKMVRVKNRILKSPTSRESFKIGLGNIRKRYEVFSDKKIKMDKGEFFLVELPLLKAI